MTLRRQLLLVSLLTLVLPWAGCQFIRETESALREGQQEMLAGIAQALAESLSQFQEEFQRAQADGRFGENQVYTHPLATEPLVDGYYDEWALPVEALRRLRGSDGAIRYVAGVRRSNVYVYVEVPDKDIVYFRPRQDAPAFSDQVAVVSYDGDDGLVEYLFRSEAPGRMSAASRSNGRITDETRIVAEWQETTGGYRLEARIPRSILGERVGIVVSNTSDPRSPGIRSASFSGELPGRLVVPSPILSGYVEAYVQPGLRIIVTDLSGWRLAQAGSTTRPRSATQDDTGTSRLLQFAYNLILEPGDQPSLAGPDASGREQQAYIDEALRGSASTHWFRSPDTGHGVVAVAQPVWSG
ncbi:MAG: hypothetical protein RLN69_06980, partial [Woeseiaceae bacterium]